MCGSRGRCVWLWSYFARWLVEFGGGSELTLAAVVVGVVAAAEAAA